MNKKILITFGNTSYNAELTIEKANLSVIKQNYNNRGIIINNTLVCFIFNYLFPLKRTFHNFF